MSPTTTMPDVEVIVEEVRHGGGGPLPPCGDGGDGGDDNNNRRKPEPRRPSPHRYYTGITLGLVSIFMFFMALAAAFLLRRGSGGDWIPVHLPVILWVNTMLLLVSSVTLEKARGALSRTDHHSFRTLWTVTTGLGILFLIGQLIGWRQLAAQGVFMATNPASSFFYIFTAAHGVHLLGGVGALIYVLSRKFEGPGIALPTAAEVASYYWHFMDGLWVFLLALLYLGK